MITYLTNHIGDKRIVNNSMPFILHSSSKGAIITPTPKTPPSPSQNTIGCEQVSNKMIHLDFTPNNSSTNEAIPPDVLQWIGRVDQQFPSLSLSSTGNPKFLPTTKESLFQNRLIKLKLNDKIPKKPSTAGYILLRVFSVHLYNSTNTDQVFNIHLQQSANPTTTIKGIDRTAKDEGSFQDSFLVSINPKTDPLQDSISLHLIEQKEKKKSFKKFINEHFRRSPISSSPSTSTTSTSTKGDHQQKQPTTHITLPLRTMFNSILDGAMQTVSTLAMNSRENIEETQYIPGTLGLFLSNTNGLLGAPQICGRFFLVKGGEDVVGEISLHMIASNGSFIEGDALSPLPDNVNNDAEHSKNIFENNKTITTKQEQQEEIEYPFKENIEYQQYLTVMIDDHSWERMWVILSGGRLHFQHHLHREIDNAGRLDLSTVRAVDVAAVGGDSCDGLENVVRITFDDMTELLAFADDTQTSLAWVNALYKEIWDKEWQGPSLMPTNTATQTNSYTPVS